MMMLRILCAFFFLQLSLLLNSVAELTISFLNLCMVTKLLDDTLIIPTSYGFPGKVDKDPPVNHRVGMTHQALCFPV